jgi:hypothetical protein
MLENIHPEVTGFYEIESDQSVLTVEVTHCGVILQQAREDDGETGPLMGKVASRRFAVNAL